jgi:hypothetical protein
MHSFAVIAGFAAAANAYAYGYPAQNATSVEAPVYPAASSAAGYVASSAGAYPVSSAAVACKFDLFVQSSSPRLIMNRPRLHHRGSQDLVDCLLRGNYPLRRHQDLRRLPAHHHCRR